MFFSDGALFFKYLSKRRSHAASLLCSVAGWVRAVRAVQAGQHVCTQSFRVIARPRSMLLKHKAVTFNSRPPIK